MPEDTPRSLLERLQEEPDDNASWKRFVLLYTPWMQDWLWRLGSLRRDDPDTEEIIQEVFRAVLQELPHFRHSGRPGAFRAWLKQVLVHRLQNFQRSQHRLTGRVSEWADRLEALTDPGSDLGRRWDNEHHAYVLTRLTEMVRDHFSPYYFRVFERTVLNEERPAEVARDLDTTPNAVIVARSRVLGWLRKEARGLLD